MATQTLESSFATLEGSYIMRPATLDDVAGAVAVFNACSRQLLGVEEFDADNYRLEWEVPGFNLGTDARVVVTPGGKVVACMEVWDLLDSHVRVNFFGHVHPDHQGRGIGAALVRWAEARARLAIDKAPAGTRVFMLSGALGADRAAQGIFRSEGSTWRATVGEWRSTSTPVRLEARRSGRRESSSARCASVRTSAPRFRPCASHFATTGPTSSSRSRKSSSGGSTS